MKIEYKQSYIKIATSILLMVLFSYASIGQRGDMRERIKEKIKVEKIGYITSELDLSSDEATKFWPVYNEYEAKKESNREQLQDLYNKDQSDAGQSLNQYLKLKEEEYLIEKTYIEKFKKVLPPKKVLKLLTSEKKFKEELIKKVKQRMRKDRDF